MERITGKNNTVIKDTKKLITSSRERKSRGLFVLEGLRLSFDVLNSVYKLKLLLVTENAYSAHRDKLDMLISAAEEAYFITDELASRISDTKTPQGVFAVCEMKKGNTKLCDKVIALDGIQDPANIGAVFRTAEALGINSIIISNSCDIYNPKALRASMGGVLRIIPVETDDLESTLKELKKTHRVYSTVPDRNALSITKVDFSSPCVCVIGNEANGVSEGVLALSDMLITIPMLGRAESLNAGAAAAITMWEMLR